MSEPYQDLDPDTRDRAVVVLLGWAARQRYPWKPFIEYIDGSTITPYDLLSEPPPTENVPRYKMRPIFLWNRLFRPRNRRAWAHVLNLIAVSAKHGEESVDELLNDIAGRTEAAGAGGVS
jgi:hypothetical protein